MSTIQFGRDERERDPLLARSPRCRGDRAGARPVARDPRTPRQAPAAVGAARPVLVTGRLAASVRRGLGLGAVHLDGGAAPGDGPARIAVCAAPGSALAAVCTAYACLGPEYVIEPARRCWTC